MTTKSTIYLLRHGETVWNTEQRLQGHLNSPLTQRGKQQAENNGARLKSAINGHPFRLISSPLGRCLDTAVIIGSVLTRGIQIDQDSRLMELCYGDWEGRTKEEIETHDGDAFLARKVDRWNVSAPHGENYADVAERMTDWLQDLVEETGIIVAVSHGCAGRILRSIYGKIPKHEVHNLSEKHDEIFVLQDGNIQKLQ